MDAKLTMVIEAGENGWFVGQIAEIPGVLTQGKTVEETKENLMDALNEYLAFQREERESDYAGKEVLMEELAIEAHRAH